MDVERLHCPRAGGRLRWKDSNVVGAMRGDHIEYRVWWWRDGVRKLGRRFSY